MTIYHVSVDFGSGLDLKGKIAASLLIRKMVEYLGKQYESKVDSIQDTHCEVTVKSNKSGDESASIRSQLADMTSVPCTITVTCEGSSVTASAPYEKTPVSTTPEAPVHNEAAPSSTAIDKIHALIGATEFKALADEIIRMSTALRALQDKSYLEHNSFLFSIDDGFGLTTSISLFAKLLHEQKLISSKEYSEIVIPNHDDADDVAKFAVALKKELRQWHGSVVCLDLTQCQSSLSKPPYRDLLRSISSEHQSVLVFRVPFLEQKALQSIESILDDVFFIRPVTFIPMDFEDLSACASHAASEYGFTLDATTEPILAQLVAHEKSDGRFYGIRTIEKIVNRMVYEKLKQIPAGAAPGGLITETDLRALDMDGDLQDLTGADRLNQLIGMESVAQQLDEIISLIEFSIKNASSQRPSIHMKFVGNPGTGKTTVARLLGQMLKERGILRKGVFFEYGGTDLIAKYVGHTAPRVAQICRDAYGSVLFIDEAYSLAVKEETGGTASFNAEALNTLLAEMENHRDDMVVIMAGYEHEIADLMRSNPGLDQRMPYTINFPNYSREDLSEIFFAYARKDFLFGEEFISTVREYFTTLPNNIYLSPTFANARFVRNVFERTMSKAVMRAQLEKADLTTLLPIDFEKATEEIKDNASAAMMFGKDKSGAVMFSEEDTKIKFADVCGEDEAKELLQEMVDFLRNPAKYHEIGARIPHGALLYGPPGTGKTMLAKAVAGEAGVPFLSISGSEFVDKFVGAGAEKVRGLFEKARSLSPCIVFIDEIDAVGAARHEGSSGSGDSVLIQLLTEMDGFDDKTEVIVLAATNRPNLLDPALRRPGRFDRQVPVELPDLEGRVQILNYYLSKVKCEDNIDVNAVARMAAGTSGAELRNIVNEAALMALRLGRDKICQKDLEESIDIISVGYLKKNDIMSEHEKLVTCYHEIGHAMLTALQTHTAPIQKITILPRTSGVLGFAQHLETADPVMHSRTQMENQIAVLCAGRAAEEVHFNEVYTGASNDIERATRTARLIIAYYGMTKEFDMVRMVHFDSGYGSNSCSDETAHEIDMMVREIVGTQHRKAYDILKANEAKLDELAHFLLEKETITGDEFMAILNG